MSDKIISAPEEKETDEMVEITDKVDLQAFVEKTDAGDNIVLRIYKDDVYDGAGFSLGTDLSEIVLEKLKEAGVLDA